MTALLSIIFVTSLAGSLHCIAMRGRHAMRYRLDEPTSRAWGPLERGIRRLRIREVAA